MARRGVSRTIWIILIIVVLAGVAAGEYELSNSEKNTTGPTEVDLHIIEDDPVLQIDHFYPDTIFVSPNETISLAVQNQDDETRVFTLTQFGINVTISSGTTQRITFQANKLGNFSYFSPISPPSPVSAGRKGPCLEGFFEVTQNATLITTTGTPPPPPSAAAAAAAAAGPIGGCSATPLTAPSP
jgi:hypothetical protein